MIRYALRCRAGHSFESWFQSAAAFDALRDAGHVACPDCGDTTVEKALMAPQVRPARRAAAAGSDQAGAQPAEDAAPVPAAGGPLSTPRTTREAQLAELRRRIEARSEYVGLSFASEARLMHAGETPERPIHGEAKLEDAKALLDEGVPVAPLPFMPARRTN